MSEPTERQIEDWNIHNDHADNEEGEVTFVREVGEMFPQLRHFEYAHLPESLQPISKIIGDAAWLLCGVLYGIRERRGYVDYIQGEKGLQRLLEAKDAFVRAAIPVKKN